MWLNINLKSMFILIFDCLRSYTFIVHQGWLLGAVLGFAFY